MDVNNFTHYRSALHAGQSKDLRGVPVAIAWVHTIFPQRVGIFLNKPIFTSRESISEVSRRCQNSGGMVLLNSDHLLLVFLDASPIYGITKLLYHETQNLTYHCSLSLKRKTQKRTNRFSSIGPSSRRSR